MEDIKFGEQIVLSGFNSLDGGTMHILRKMVGSEVRKLSDRCSNFVEMKLVMKLVHETEASKIYEVKGFLDDNGKIYASEVTDRNVFQSVSKVFEKILHEMGARE
jgi:hypothetical protein